MFTSLRFVKPLSTEMSPVERSGVGGRNREIHSSELPDVALRQPACDIYRYRTANATTMLALNPYPLHYPLAQH